MNMRMKKIFFLGALITSAMSYAQVNWYDVVEPINSIAQGTTNYESVQVNAAGDILLYGNIGSVGMDPHAVIMGDTVATVAFKENASNTNSAPFFVKVNEDGNVQWMVVCNDGRFTSYAGLALEDGGMLVAATAYQSQQSVISFANHYTPAQTAKYDQSKEQYGVLLKIAANGQPTILAKFEQAEAGKTDGIAFRDIVTDGTDYYVLANVKSAVKIAGKTDTIAPTAAGACLAILKFNAAGAYQGALMTDGLAMTSSQVKLVSANDKLYLVSTFKGTTADQLQLGNASVAVPNDLTNIAVFEADASLNCAIHVILAEKQNNKNVVQTYDVEVKDQYLYLNGNYAGGLATLSNTTGKNAPFILRFNTQTGAVDAALDLPVTGTGIGGVMNDAMLQKDDSLYAYYYDWGATGDRVFLQALDADLKLGSRIPLINTATMSTTRGAAFQGDNLIYAYYAAKGASSLSADNTISINPTAYRGLVVSQKLFNDSASAAPEVKAAQKAIKQLNEGNVFILSDEAVYDIKGQKVK